MKITITIEKGNEAVRTGSDMVTLVNNITLRIYDAVATERDDSGKILDLNGNTVGKWEVEQ